MSKTTEGATTESAEQTEQTDDRSHYARYKGAHQKYEQSEKGQAAREKYMGSDKGKATRKRYMKRRYAEQKEILRQAKEAGIGKN